MRSASVAGSMFRPGVQVRVMVVVSQVPGLTRCDRLATACAAGVATGDVGGELLADTSVTPQPILAFSNARSGFR